jgi:hypothetical protein
MSDNAAAFSVNVFHAPSDHEVLFAEYGVVRSAASQLADVADISVTKFGCDDLTNIAP